MADPAAQFQQAGIQSPSYTPVETKLNAPITLPQIDWGNVTKSIQQGYENVINSPLNPVVAAQRNATLDFYKQVAQNPNYYNQFKSLQDGKLSISSLASIDPAHLVNPSLVQPSAPPAPGQTQVQPQTETPKQGETPKTPQTETPKQGETPKTPQTPQATPQIDASRSGDVLNAYHNANPSVDYKSATRNDDGSWTLTTADGKEEHYSPEDVAAKLQSQAVSTPEHQDFKRAVAAVSNVASQGGPNVESLSASNTPGPTTLVQPGTGESNANTGAQIGGTVTPPLQASTGTEGQTTGATAGGSAAPATAPVSHPVMSAQTALQLAKHWDTGATQALYHPIGPGGQPGYTITSKSGNSSFVPLSTFAANSPGAVAQENVGLLMGVGANVGAAQGATQGQQPQGQQAQQPQQQQPQPQRPTGPPGAQGGGQLGATGQPPEAPGATQVALQNKQPAQPPGPGDQLTDAQGRPLSAYTNVANAGGPNVQTLSASNQPGAVQTAAPGTGSYDQALAQQQQQALQSRGVTIKHDADHGNLPYIEAQGNDPFSTQRLYLGLGGGTWQRNQTDEQHQREYYYQHVDPSDPHIAMTLPYDTVKSRIDAWTKGNLMNKLEAKDEAELDARRQVSIYGNRVLDTLAQLPADQKNVVSQSMRFLQGLNADTMAKSSRDDLFQQFVKQIPGMQASQQEREMFDKGLTLDQQRREFSSAIDRLATATGQTAEDLESAAGLTRVPIDLSGSAKVQSTGDVSVLPGASAQGTISTKMSVPVWQANYEKQLDSFLNTNNRFYKDAVTKLDPTPEQRAQGLTGKYVNVPGLYHKDIGELDKGGRIHDLGTYMRKRDWTPDSSSTPATPSQTPATPSQTPAKSSLPDWIKNLVPSIRPIAQTGGHYDVSHLPDDHIRQVIQAAPVGTKMTLNGDPAVKHPNGLMIPA